MTLTALTNAARYDWPTWFMGIMRSFIGGGAGAIAGAFGPMTVDSKDWNLGQGLHNVLWSMAIGFVIGGIVNMAVYLQTHGAPDQLQQTLKTAAEATGKAAGAIAEAQTQVAEEKK